MWWHAGGSMKDLRWGLHGWLGTNDKVLAESCGHKGDLRILRRETLASKGAFSRLNRPEAVNRKGCGTSTQEKAQPPDPMLMISVNTLWNSLEKWDHEGKCPTGDTVKGAPVLCECPSPSCDFHSKLGFSHREHRKLSLPSAQLLMWTFSVTARSSH